jgi:hypothetical protein
VSVFKLGAKKATVAGAVLLSVLVAISSAATASADVRIFSPVAKTPKALVFKIDGLDPMSIRQASVTFRQSHGRPRTRTLSLRSMRAAAQRGTLTLRRGRGSDKGGKVQVVVEEPTRYTVPPWVPSGCAIDATSQILSWIASVPDDSALVFGAKACYRVEGTLEIRGRNLTFDGNGSTFKSLDPPSDQRALWRAWDSSVAFRNMTIAGSYANGGAHTPALQHAHAIDLRGTHGVVENVSMSDLAGDCVYFGLGSSRSSGSVRDSSCQRISRNAVSVTAGDDIRVTRVTTHRIGFIAFDVEPNEGPGNGSSRVVFDSNTIGSYYLMAYAVIGNAPIVDQAFTNNRLVGQGLKVGVIDRHHRPAQVRITGNRSDTPAGPGAVSVDGVDRLTVSSNTVPLTNGLMARIRRSCAVSVSGNSYPGGSRERSITNRSC